MKMPRPLLIFSQSDYFIQIAAMNSHTSWQTVQIQISWLLKKPTDLDLHCLQRQGISGFSRTRAKFSNLTKVKYSSFRGHPRGQFGGRSLPMLADFLLSWAEREVKMYRMYRVVQNLDQNFSLKSWNCCKTSPSLKALGWPLLLDYLSTHIITITWQKLVIDQPKQRKRFW